MNKEQLVGKIAKDAKITKVVARKALDSFLDAVKKELKKGGKVGLVGFGTFSTAKRKARVGINPATQQKINIPAKKVVKFKAGKEFSNYVKK